MRLLYVHETLGSLGGAEANVFITASELSRRGVHVGLLTRRESGKNTQAWKTLFHEGLFDSTTTSGQDAVSRFQPNLLYVHKWSHLPSLEALRATGIPMARMVHDHDVYCLRSYKYHPLTRRICTRPAGPWCVFPCLGVVKRERNGPLPLRWLSYREKMREIELNRRFEAHFVVTEFMRNELVINGFPPERIHLFPPVPREVDPLTSSFGGRNLIVFAGQMIRGKGVDVLLESLALMRESFECILLGDGSHRGHCEKLARRLGLGDRVRFAGFVPQEELRQYYQEATAVVVPSVWPEPIATIGLEVMRYGLPVVAFDAGGIRDWLQDGVNGHLVPWMDRRRFAAALDTLMADKARARQMGEAGRRLVREKYGFEDYLERLDRTLQQLAGGG